MTEAAIQREIVLTLPVPPSPNRWRKNPWAQQAQKDAYRAEAWVAALRQEKPVRDPAETVTLGAMLYLCRLRDEDNATGSLKWAIDALKMKQTGALRWRQGIADLCGYFVDDDPAHCSIACEQVRVKTKKEERLEITILEAA